MSRFPPMVSFVAPSGTGKTTLLEKIIRILADRGVRVAVVKHDAHRVQLDKPGKDTWRFRQAGAWRVTIAGDDQLAVFSGVDGDLTVGGLVSEWLVDADLVLTEGFRKSGLPMIRVHRSAVHDPTWEAPADPIAWVSDLVESPDGSTCLALDNPQAVADFVCDRFLGDTLAEAPTTLVLPAGPSIDLARVQAAAQRLGGAFHDVLVVRSREVADIPNVRTVQDLRPDIGPLSALLTALAAANTPQILFLGKRHLNSDTALVHNLATAHPLRADVLALCSDGLAEPTFARYGHRCLPAIHAALITGEYKMTGWWGQVRAQRVMESVWREWRDV